MSVATVAAAVATCKRLGDTATATATATATVAEQQQLLR